MEIKIEGFKELERALLELKTATAKNVARRVLKKAAQPVADRANASAPRDQGDLSESYVVSTKLNRSQKREVGPTPSNEVVVYVGSNDPAAVQQEFGNAHHGPQPHFRPAWDTLQDGVLRAVVDDMADEIQKTAQRVRRRAKT